MYNYDYHILQFCNGTSWAASGSVAGPAWTAQTAAAGNSWDSVTYGNGLFAAVSTLGTPHVMTWPDGVTWTLGHADEFLVSVTYGNGLFVAVGIKDVMTSPDGITWTAQTPAEANAWDGVTYANGLFVAVAPPARIR